MLTKILQVFFKVLTVLPALITDVESDVSKIRTDKTLVAKIHDTLDAVAAVFDEVTKALAG